MKHQDFQKLVAAAINVNSLREKDNRIRHCFDKSDHTAEIESCLFVINGQSLTTEEVVEEHNNWSDLVSKIIIQGQHLDTLETYDYHSINWDTDDFLPAKKFFEDMRVQTGKPTWATWANSITV